MASSHGLALGCLSFLLLVVIVQGEKQQHNTTVVSHLPGYHGPLPFSLQTGYVEVDKGNGVRLFYYFVQSERSPAEDPVLLWLTGAPVAPPSPASSMRSYYNFSDVAGPLSFQSHSYVDGLPELVYRTDSWTKVANIIFLDSPVGAGFSYAATDDGYKSSATQTINQIAIFLTKWYEEHSEFLLNPLYIAGDSYSGLIVPPLTFRIARGIETGDGPVLNLKGYIIGNPLTDAKIDMAAKVPYAHRMGLISDEQYEIYRESCSSVTVMPQNMQCTNCLDAIDKDTGYTMCSIWANDRAVREALGVHTRFATVYSNNITFATVKGAGHTAPQYKPKQCLAMVSSWLSNSPL
ncbi:hypothetical protein ACQ4PT_066041 [Festuca glaucescens]